MSKHLDLVRYRNDGDDFHVLWTARRALRILDPTSGLVAVAVEGISENEAGDGPDVEAGQLVIDTTEYYGSEAIADAIWIAYCQLKYSTTAPNEPWTLSGLKKTLAGFADRFKEYCSKFPHDVVTSKIRFRFISNRPIAETVVEAFKVSAVKTPTVRLSSDIKSIIQSLRKATGLSAKEFQSFAAQVDLLGDQDSRAEQKSSLEAEAKRLSPTFDFDVMYRMKELVRSKTLSDTKDNNTIRLSSLERAFGLERELLPAKPLFDSVRHLIPRIQESTIAETLLSAQWPVIIHAAGGVGKSVLAQRLPELLPLNSEAVIFDGFARGAYRSPLDRRHKHELGLVQIANTLATRGLCDILLPTSASEEAYLQAFRNRLEQAIAVVRSRSSDAILLIVLDAADNSVKASQIHHDRCFISALLQDPPPEGCRIVALARSHRVDDLHPSSQAIRIPLQPFSVDESGEHLRGKFPDASGEDIEAFHRFTDNNPRVQANALALCDDLPALLKSLGPSIQSVENLIGGQLKAALDRVIEDQACLRTEIDFLCIALASLPPLVPIRVLAMASCISMDAIRSFASDFAGGRPIMIHDDSVQFRDEPVETWFHETFTAQPEQYGHIVDILMPLALKDGYIASAIPSLLWCAGRYGSLMELALRGEELETDDPVEKREMLFRRVQYALKAALTNRNFEDCTKLLQRIAEEVATSDRQSSFLMDHSDLVATLAGPDVVYDFVFRKRTWNMSSTPYVHSAAMLVANRRHKIEARHFLDMSLEWLSEWSASDDPERVEVEADDIAAYAYVYFYLDGPIASAAFLARWTPRTLSFEAGSILASRLIDTGNADLAQNLLVAANNDIYLCLAIILELSRVCLLPTEDQVVSAFKLLEAETPPINLSEISDKIDIGLAIVALAEMAARIGLPSVRVIAILNYYQHVPARAYYNFDRNWFREAILRATSLKIALDGRDIALNDVVPASVAEKMEKPNSEHIREVREFKEVYGALVPWYRLRAQALLNVYGIDRYDSLLVAAQKDCGINQWSWRGNHELSYAANEISKVWLDALILSGCANAETANNFEVWLAAQKVFIYTPTWTHLARCAAHHPEIHAAALSFASRARELIAGEHGDARQTADSFAALSRSTFPITHKEAASYFLLALEHLNRLGEELYERLRCLMEIANHAALTGHAQPREAYRFARIVELFHAYNNHKFPWSDAGETVENLCATSGIAIVSRWNDRDKGWLNDIFPPVIISLLEKNIITPQVATALHVFPGYWRLYETAPLFFNKTTDAALLQDILDTLVLDQEYEGYKETSSKALLDIARHRHLNCDRLEKLETFHASSPIEGDSYQNDAAKYSGAPSYKQKEPDWGFILAAANFDTPEGIETAAEKSKLGEHNYPWKEFFQKLRTSIAPAKWSDHILALSKSQISEFLLLDAIEAAAIEWKSSQAVKLASAEAIKSIITNRPHGFLSHGWGVGKEIERCVRLTGMTKGQIYEALLKALADHIEAVSAEALFLLTSSLTQNVLTPEQALSVLTFSLDRLEPILKDDDGDGLWRVALAPPERIPQAIAGFLYGMLGSHKSENRWRAAHAVRRLCRFHQHDIISALVDLLPAEELPVFTDSELPFYPWHARMHLIISFARSSVEVPDVLRPYLPTFLYWALEGPPHVLIRHYAAQAALAILQATPDRCVSTTVEKLRKVNVSPYATVPEIRGNGVGWHMPRSGQADYYFPHDFDRYWLGPLSEVFNCQYHEVAKRTESWIISNRRNNFNGGWDEDPRNRRNYFRDMDTMCGSSSCPEIDTYSFYLSYHALFCTAGELLAEKPTVGSDDWHDGWDKWLKGYMLTRPDGKWLSDRRDFAPLERQRWQIAKLPWDREKEWRWSILAEDFDRALGFTESVEPKYLTVGGSWNVSEDIRREDIHVSSALVSSKTSLALLRALQTADDFHDFKIPDEDEHFEIIEQGFKMSGWIQEPYCEFGFDKYDPLSGKIPWPGPRPGRKIIRLFKLIPDEEGRTWRTGDSDVIWSCIWGDRKEGRHNRAGNYGQRLAIDVDFLISVLQRLDRDLIVEVEITRERDREAEEKIDYKYQSYTRIYLVRANGELNTLHGCHRLRPKAG